MFLTSGNFERQGLLLISTGGNTAHLGPYSEVTGRESAGLGFCFDWGGGGG